MAVRFDAATDRISYTASNPPSTTAFTITAWALVAVDTDTNATIARLHASTGGSTIATWATGSDGLSGPNYFTTGGSISNATNFTVGSWRKVAICATGTTGKSYVATVGGGTEVDSATVATGQPTGITLGGRSSGDGTEWFNGRLAYVRVWSTELTQSEIEAEWGSATPVRTANLWADWPLTVHTDLTDHSGNGRNLTAGSTATTTEADPPITTTNTGVVEASIPMPTAAVPGTGSAAATLAGSVPMPTATLTATATTTVTVAGSIPVSVAGMAAEVTAPAALAGSVPLQAVTLDGQVSQPGEVAATIPMQASDVAATTATTGAVTAAIPTPTATVEATAGTAGELAGSIPMPAAALAADGGSTTGELAGAVPMLSADLVVVVRDTGVLAGQIPLLSASVTGGVDLPAALTGAIPLQVARLTTRRPVVGPLHAADVQVGGVLVASTPASSNVLHAAVA